MHRQIANELTLILTVCVEGQPLLIKSGREAGADPRLPDMYFVRVVRGEGAPHHDEIYLPGSSLKGTLRSYSERVLCTLQLKCCDPFNKDHSCGARIEVKAKQLGVKRLPPAEIYKELCWACRLFGHTPMAGRLAVEDARLIGLVKTDQRDGVAIDRISAGVAEGPFTLEIVTQGKFQTRLRLRNFELWQIGLLAIALRDLGSVWAPLGFATSRGLGRLSLRYDALTISYPGRFVADDGFHTHLYGLRHLMDTAVADDYGLLDEERLALPENGRTPADNWGRLGVTYSRHEPVLAVLKETVPAWKRMVESQAKGG